MKVTGETLSVSTKGRGLYEITREVQRIVQKSDVQKGICTVFVRHTSASLLIQENADPAVLRDLERWMERLAPENPSVYEHNDEGPDDMPSHLRTSITRSSETIPVQDRKLVLGTWQGIYVFEHRHAPHRREVVVQVMGV